MRRPLAFHIAPALLVALIALAAFAVTSQGPRTLSFPPPLRLASGSIGWDVSYPQCSRDNPPAGSFGIVGLNAGRPFTTNPCVAKLWAWAEGLLAPSLYVNAAFARVYSRHLASSCRSSAPASVTDPRQRRAWAIGCQEADYDLTVAPSVPAAWWLDVELANSWSRSRPDLNRIAIQALVEELRRRTGRPVGLYSYSKAWERITGERGWSPLGASANWIAPTVKVNASTAGPLCRQPGFSGLPVTFVQFLRNDSGGAFDADLAC